MDKLYAENDRHVSNQQGAGQYNAGADSGRRMEALAQMDAQGITEKLKPSFSFV